MRRKSPKLVAAFACFIFLSLSLSTPALASDPVYGPGNTIMAVICAEANGYKDYVLHPNDHFPPGSTVKIYVEASGKT
ncbi:MAG: hypothetical protein KAT65_18720, partial [Methanophagales archaeon]|nr:hypothetical protein [Methanophagales archaeon]